MSEHKFTIEKDGLLAKYEGPGGDVVIPEGVTRIVAYGLALESIEFGTVTLPDSLTESWGIDAVGRRAKAFAVSENHPAFRTVDGVLYNKELTTLLVYPGLRAGELTIPKETVNSYGSLNAQKNLTALHVEPGSETFCEVDGMLFSPDRKRLLQVPGGQAGVVHIPAEMEEIRCGAFVPFYSPYLTAFEVDPANTVVTSVDGVLYNKDVTKLLAYPRGKEGAYTVPSTVQEITDGAFKMAAHLTELVIPLSVNKMESYSAFDGCVNLKRLTIPAGVVSNLVAYAPALEYVELTGDGSRYSRDGVIFAKWNHSGSIELMKCPNGRTGSYTVPADVNEINYNGFSGCTRLEEIRFEGKVPKMDSSAFNHCRNLRIPSEYLQVTGKVPTAFASRLSAFSETDRQWLTIFQTAKAWKEALNEHMKNHPDKAAYFQGVLDVLSGQKKIAKATGLNVVEFVLEWYKELTDEQIRSLRAIFMEKKCTDAVKSMESDSRLKDALGGTVVAAAPKKTDNAVEQIVQDNWISGKLTDKIKKQIKAGIPYAGSDKLCSRDALVFILTAYASQVGDCTKNYGDYKTVFVKPKPHPVADQVAAALDNDVLRSTLESLSTDPDNLTTGYLLAYGRYASGDQIIKLRSKMREWESWYQYGISGRKGIMIAWGGILLNDSREAMLAADKAKRLDAYAEIRGTTADEVRDSVLSEFGLDENGKKVCDLGNGRSVEIRLNADLTLGVYDLTANKVVKSIPKKGADPALHAEVSAAFSDMKKNAKKIAKARNDLLLNAFLSAKEFDAAAWQGSYLKNPLLRQVASLLVWEQGGVTFTILDHSIVTHDESAVTLTDAPIKLAHPMEMDTELVESWQKYFNTRGLKQMFPQIWEPIFDPATIEEDRYKGCTVPVLTMSQQGKHGMGVEGLSAYSEEFWLWLTDCKIEAEPDHWRYEPGWNDNMNYTLGKFTFEKYTRWTNHIVGWFDRRVILDKIAQDDPAISALLPGFTLAQITEYLDIATRDQRTNCIALLLDYKNSHFGDFDPMAEFSLDL